MRDHTLLHMDKVKQQCQHAILQTQTTRPFRTVKTQTNDKAF